MAKHGQTGSNMVKNGHKWSQMAKMANMGKIFKNDKNGQKW